MLRKFIEWFQCNLNNKHQWDINTYLFGADGKSKISVTRCNSCGIRSIYVPNEEYDRLGLGKRLGKGRYE